MYLCVSRRTKLPGRGVDSQKVRETGSQEEVGRVKVSEYEWSQKREWSHIRGCTVLLAWSQAHIWNCL